MLETLRKITWKECQRCLVSLGFLICILLVRFLTLMVSASVVQQTQDWIPETSTLNWLFQLDDSKFWMVPNHCVKSQKPVFHHFHPWKRIWHLFCLVPFSARCATRPPIGWLCLRKCLESSLCQQHEISHGCAIAKKLTLRSSKPRIRLLSIFWEPFSYVRFPVGTAISGLTRLPSLGQLLFQLTILLNTSPPPEKKTSLRGSQKIPKRSALKWEWEDAFSKPRIFTFFKILGILLQELY